MKNIVRLENCNDYSEVENLTREAFWNVYRPGCTEHYILHRYRKLPEFIPQLSFLIEDEGKIVAHIMYSKGEIICDNGKIIPIIIFGPISVLPGYQGRGYGSELINYSLNKAKDMGFGAVVITGDPKYYQRFGFENARSRGIYYSDLPRDEEMPFLMVKELKKGYLKEVIGTYKDPSGYLVDNSEVAEFDLKFPIKEKLKLPGQLI
ncbi:GNAT family N-acetyltransferase [Anaerosphaera multitolerans]|uniref:N-acetyltransferase n=1 Tax=Anaerosphaera multitolerans TaxID=2487351 RepID=A0A437S8Q1_9FIRM|nr:N-acetyltransferase [Anaerosphaera multitolerans]RVU55480.1 N-acetyltransferase [Anaerosphaera multitolerans]